jgi:hypothetical protein
VSPSRLLATDLNTETSTSNYHETFFPFLVQSPWNLGTKQKLFLVVSGLVLYSRGTDNEENTVLLLRSADNTENTCHVPDCKFICPLLALGMERAMQKTQSPLLLFNLAVDCLSRISFRGECTCNIIIPISGCYIPQCHA